jgi:hypothetical protein
METLAKVKRRGDYTHNFVKRNEHVAIYDTCLDSGEIIGYEVFLVRVQKAKSYSMAGREIKLAEKEYTPPGRGKKPNTISTC